MFPTGVAPPEAGLTVQRSPTPFVLYSVPSDALPIVAPPLKLPVYAPISDKAAVEVLTEYRLPSAPSP